MIVPLIRRQRTDGTVALSMWLVDGSPVVVKVSQADYDAAVALKGGEMPGRPTPTARFLMACGGIPALDTADGYPSRGDAWEEDDPELGRVLVVATSDGFDWAYWTTSASKPGRGEQTSRRTGFLAGSTGNRMRLSTFSSKTFDGVELDTQARGDVREDLDDIIPNHRSVTFDATSNGVSSAATTLTIGHTVANEGDRYLMVGVCLSSVSDPSGITYNSDALTNRMGIQTPGAGSRRGCYWDMVAPDVGTANVVVATTDAQTVAAGVSSFYGVDQSSPRIDTDTESGTSDAPSVTVTGGTADDMAVAVIVWRFFGGASLTPDGTWTAMWSIGNAVGRDNAAAYKTGGASVTYTGSLGVTNDWVFLAAMLRASTGGSASLSPSASASPSSSVSPSPSPSSSASPSVSPSASVSPSSSSSLSPSPSASLSPSASQSPSSSPSPSSSVSPSTSPSPSPSVAPQDAIAWGEADPDPGEESVTWQRWQTAADTPVTVSGDQDFGTAVIANGTPGVSPVTDTGDAAAKTFTLTLNKYGTGAGSPTTWIRGSASSFGMHAGSPSWTAYSAPVTEEWRYVQVKIESD